ncbi:MAG: hypothetical protein DWB93_01380 [Candidatus Poseidoniales archaeon]|nr:MAG: hypothetical protein DWB93_01380 [Candidatus Poseidoniales archaeon]
MKKSEICIKFCYQYSLIVIEVTLQVIQVVLLNSLVMYSWYNRGDPQAGQLKIANISISLKYPSMLYSIKLVSFLHLIKEVFLFSFKNIFPF